ncbi:MAG: CCA tRNA nucleotidyltransferase [Chloroflexaceae bacterium]|nr:CCA tRNA nucleotidyltransferase [Chloroflexaceae bacterium]
MFVEQTQHLTGALSQAVQHLLAQVAAVAAQHQLPVWLVGGVVRDLLLGLPIDRDLDLAVEGDAIALAGQLLQLSGAHLVASHPPFGTATLQLPHPDDDGMLTLDLARTRVETYAHVGALPTVAPASMQADLARRDFSINAMACRLQAARTAAGDWALQPATLLDPFNGRADLQASVLQVLHKRSFADDPTRILRGVRLAARLGLRFANKSAVLLQQALQDGMLGAVSPERLRTELYLALSEPAPERVLEQADRLDLTPHLLAGVRWSDVLAARCLRVRTEPDLLVACLDRSEHTLALLYAGLITYDLPAQERRWLVQHYRLANDCASLFEDIIRVQGYREQLAQPGLANSTLDAILRPVNSVALGVVHYAESQSVGTTIAHYLGELRQLNPILDGHALQQLGVAPGPQLGALLRGLRAARLDGLVVSRTDEETWVSEQVHANNSTLPEQA